MADLWFKIKADTTELDKAYKRLGDIERRIDSFTKKLNNSSPEGKMFKTIARELSSLEKEHEKAIKKIVGLENALSNISKAKEAAAVVNETGKAANEASKLFDKYTGSVSSLSQEIKKLNKEYNGLSLEDRNSTKGVGVKQEIASLEAQRKVEKDSMRELQQEYVNSMKMQELQKGSIVSLRAELRNLQAAYDGMSGSLRKGNTGKELLATISLVNKELSEAEQASGRFFRNVGNYSSGWNGLGVQVQQVARELPSLAIGANTFFLAISNNLPMLADELKRAKDEYKALIAEGKTATPVWKQLVSSIFSWQTALVAVVTVLSLYGKEIVQWTKELFGAKKALSETYKTMDDFSKAVGEGSGSQIALVEKLAAAWKRLGSDVQAQKKFILESQDAFRQLGLSITSVNDANRILIERKGAVIDAIVAQAMADAVSKVAQQETEKVAKARVEYNRKVQEKTKERNLRGHGDSFFSLDQDLMNEKRWIEGLEQDLEKVWLIADGYNEKAKGILEKNSIISDDNLKEGTIPYLEKLISTQREELNNLVIGSKEFLALQKEIKVNEKELEKAQAKKESKKSAYIDSYAQQQAVEKANQDITDKLLSSVREREQSEIDLMKDGADKTLRQINLNYELRKDAIAKNERDELDLLKKSEREKWEQDNPKYKEKNLQFKPTVTALPEERVDFYKGESDLAKKQQEKATADLLKSKLESYRNFNEQRKAIEEQYNKDVSYLEAQRTEENKATITDAIAEAKRQKEEQIKNVNDAEAALAAKDSDFIKRLYGDYSQMSFDAFGALISQAEKVREYLSGNTDIEGLTFITPAELDRISKAPDQLEALKRALDSLLGEKYGKSPWGKMFSEFDEGMRKLKKAKGLKDIAGSIGLIAGAASNAARDLASMFEEMGESEIADAVAGMQQLFSTVSNIGMGFAQGGVVGGVAAAIGEAVNLIGQAFAANNRHKEALRRIMNEVTAQQREYNLLLLEQNLAYEKGSTIFGEDKYGKAMNAVKVAEEALKKLDEALKVSDRPKRTTLWGVLGFKDPKAELKEMYAGLASVEIKTGHKKTGLFGWGKGKDIYGSVLDEYPNLIKANGEFDAELAKIIINTREMSDENKGYLQEMIDLSEKAEEAYKQLNDYLTDIFGTLGSTMTDALVDSFKNGTDAAEAFADSVSGMLETLAKQMVYSVTIAPLVDEAQKKMMEISKDQSLTKEERFDAWSNVVAGLTSDALKEKEQFDKLLESFKQSAADNGITILEPDKDKQQQATSKGFQTMSQETGNELNGRFTALQMAGEEIKIQAIKQTDILSRMLERIEVYDPAIPSTYNLSASLAADKVAGASTVDIKPILSSIDQVVNLTGDIAYKLDGITSQMTNIGFNAQDYYSAISKNIPMIVSATVDIKNGLRRL